jgi:hypothetical protein
MIFNWHARIGKHENDFHDFQKKSFKKKKKFKKLDFQKKFKSWVSG